MHILVVHCSAVLLTDTLPIGHACRIVHDCLVSVLQLGRHCGFMFRILPWFTSVVTHVSLYPFFALLLDPCPTIVLVSNGLGRRSPRTR